jgi:hypothetical protein
VLVTSAWKGKANIMTMGWHMGVGILAIARGVLHLKRQP